ncbi:MAG TPA: DUF4255 domain-containing protein [Pyrinomonadaceae bacterium]|nr:DUF4255 domain-containing protein [Pyrinomonadaceae bacterium]
MLDFGVIADVSTTLEKVLTTALSTLNPPSVAQVHDLQGSISTTPARLTIFLYEAVEDPSARNRPRVQGTAPPDLTLQKPPMALLLRYMMTPWSGNRFTDHLILGRAMQVLYDGAIISGTQLQGGLAGTDQALKITLQLLTLEERTRVWHSVQKPYRLSVVYEVRVVNLVPVTRRVIPSVKGRSLDFATPEATP